MVDSGKRPKPVVLVVLDGWGHREERTHNAIAEAHTSVWNSLLRDYPHGLLNASELEVGLPHGQMGNSEVGHMNIGSGRVVMQDLPRIDQAISDGSLAKNPRLVEFIAKLRQPGGVCHLMGLLSPGGVHSHQHHMAALANLLAGHGIEVKIHVFLDGRDTPPKSALEYLAEFEKEVTSRQVRIATLSGRFYAMDRDKRWERVRKAYDTLASGAGTIFSSAREAIEKSYAAGVTDEFVLPCVIGDYKGMQDGDGLLMANFRADRAREILTALLDPAFREFSRKDIKFSAALGMVEYSESLSKFMPALFPPEKLTNIFGEVVSRAGLTQLRIAETEKYAHVTFFFNGGREQEFSGEERILVPSPKVATYDLKPEMSAFELTEKLEQAIASDRFDVIVVNYANTDMVGHTGDIVAAAKAVEAVDTCLGRLVNATLAKGGALLITADHGNAESMYDEETHQPHTAHTLNLVPVILVGERFKGEHQVLPQGKLADVAPTLLHLLGLPQPAEMTGKSLLLMCR
ncbi:MAG: 2,3-bisphosphoglycerate-independent phosphoglycerate mutase [Pseudomonadota bacterium]|nr:2,3-bisphosphoglycerate-independent phosphoglycerate mutase [Pseudomonadota bacterium]